jgi:hypothetical protein
MRSLLLCAQTWGLRNRHNGTTLDAEPVVRLYAALNFSVNAAASLGSRTSKGFDGPMILGFLMAKDVAFAVREQDAKEGETWGIPAVFNFGDFYLLVEKEDAHGALVGLVARVALHAKRRQS